jgi:hypothetical protein
MKEDHVSRTVSDENSEDEDINLGRHLLRIKD